MTESIYWTLADSSQVNLENPEEFLSSPELQKLSTLRFAKRQQEWLLGRWAAKSLIKSIPPHQHFSLNEIEIYNAAEGAPYVRLRGGSELPGCLSISHCDRFALCAVSSGSDARVGIDMEKIEPRSHTFVQDYFTLAECDLVDMYPVEKSEMVATLIWSAKESMLKALGVGLHWDTRKVEVREINSSIDKGIGWNNLEVVDSEQEKRGWSAWWQQRGNFIITLTGYSKTAADIRSARLVEI